MDFATLWNSAVPYAEFVRASKLEHRGLWDGLYRLARVPEWALGAVPPEAGLKLLVLAEDWCGDASNTIPVLARLADEAPGIELRILRRDENPELMNRYLTNGTRSIPVVIALDAEFNELGHWGPRPGALQDWVMGERAKGRPKAELYPEIRKWYARDRGATTLKEVLEVTGEWEAAGRDGSERGEQ
ncbi:MAG TPA: thioredoxin family protein [Gemmatimonadales bacterium]|nr:thioredoxin family protein [Gemmatimonadales bacterium]